MDEMSDQGSKVGLLEPQGRGMKAKSYRWNWLLWGHSAEIVYPNENECINRCIIITDC